MANKELENNNLKNLCIEKYPDIYNLLKDLDYLYEGKSYNKKDLIRHRVGVALKYTDNTVDMTKFEQARDEFLAKLEYKHGQDIDKRTIKGRPFMDIVRACSWDQYFNEDSKIKEGSSNVYNILGELLGNSTALLYGGYHKKYLKYKGKYLELKKSLNI